MQMKEFIFNHLILEGNANHHGTLFAGQGASWLVEAGFVSAAGLIRSRDVVCLQIHGMLFKKPVKVGNLMKIVGKIVYTGRSSLIAYVVATDMFTEELIVDGFLTFIHVDEDAKPKAHGCAVEPSNEEEKQLQQRAMELVHK